MTKYQLKEQSVYWGLQFQMRNSCLPWFRTWQDRHGTGVIFESLHPYLQVGGREKINC